MATPTYEAIATYTMPSAAASYTFTSVSSSYTDIVLIGNLMAGSTNFDIQVGNGSADTGSNYSSTRVYGNGSAAGSDRQSNNTTGMLGNVSNSATVLTNFIVSFQNYKNTSTYKSIVARFNDSSAITFAIAGLWRSTSAINTIKIYSTNASNIPSGSTFTLYGILSA
jgi:hypothetical protein